MRIRKTVRTVFTAAMLSGVVLGLTGCLYPVKISPSCQKAISDCLQRCSETGDVSGAGDQRVLTNDRSPCEEKCHNSCR